MAELVNLRQARKRKLRADQEVQATANRAKFGRTKVEKQREALEAERERSRLSQAKLTPEE
jgi:hypothetical protein